MARSYGRWLSAVGRLVGLTFRHRWRGHLAIRAARPCPAPPCSAQVPRTESHSWPVHSPQPHVDLAFTSLCTPRRSRRPLLGA